MTLAAETCCGICQIHGAVSARDAYEIGRGALWVLRHHPDPSPLPGWLLLDSTRHLGGPADFTPGEAAAWGVAVQHASALVRRLTGCDRVYAIAFGEGAPHLHLHLIPRFAHNPDTTAWLVADFYRTVIAGERAAAEPERVTALVVQARQQVEQAVLDGSSQP